MKPATITLAVLLVCAAIAAPVSAQTPAQMAKFCQFLSKHPAKAMELGAAQGMDGPQFVTSFCAAAYEDQYAANYARLQYYLMTHPGLAQQLAAEEAIGAAQPYQPVPPYQGIEPDASAAPYQAGPPYGPGYLGQNYYGANPDPIQQLAGGAIMALVGRFVGTSSGLQNNAGGYNSGPAPLSQPPYAERFLSHGTVTRALALFGGDQRAMRG